MSNNKKWVMLDDPDVMKLKYMMSTDGEIKDVNTNELIEPYHANNGIEYVLLFVDTHVRERNMTKYPNPKKLFSLELLIAKRFLEIDDSLKDKILDIKHLDDDLRNCAVDNLKWVELEEHWYDVTKDDVIPDMYQVSDLGRIRYKATKEILLSRIGSDGYNLITLKLSKPTNAGHYEKPFRINRLVANALYGDESSRDVNHIDSNRRNDFWKNLEYTTRSENIRHAVASGNIPSLADDILKDIFDDLKKYNSPKGTYERMREKYPILKEYSADIVNAVKRGFYNHRLGLPKDFRLAPCKIPIRIEEIDLVRERLIKYDGSCLKAFNSIDVNKYPKITLNVVRDIKRRRPAYEKSFKFTIEDFEMIKNMKPSKKK